MHDMERLIGEEIGRVLPMKYPYMILSELCIEEGKSAHSLISLEEDAWFFQCHFPGNPIFPGFLLMEAMGQTLLSTFIRMAGLKDGEVPLMTSVSNIRFEGLCVPGDTVLIYAELQRFKYGIAKGSVKSYRNSVCESNMLAEINMSFTLPSALRRL